MITAWAKPLPLTQIRSAPPTRLQTLAFLESMGEELFSSELTWMAASPCLRWTLLARGNRCFSRGIVCTRTVPPTVLSPSQQLDMLRQDAVQALRAELILRPRKWATD